MKGTNVGVLVKSSFRLETYFSDLEVNDKKNLNYIYNNILFHVTAFKIILKFEFPLNRSRKTITVIFITILIVSTAISTICTTLTKSLKKAIFVFKEIHRKIYFS